MKLSKFLSLTTIASSFSLLSVTAPVQTPAAQAAELPDNLASANAAMDSNLNSLNSQAAGLTGQIGEVNGVIGKLETEYAALVPQLQQKQATLRQTIRQAYVAGNPSSVEVLAGNSTISGAVGQQHYRDEISQKTQKAASELNETRKQLDSKLAEAKEKRDGLVSLQGQLTEKIETAQAQAAAKAALVQATQNKEEEYQKLRAAEQQTELAAVAAATPAASPVVSAAPRPASPPPAPRPINGRGGNPYPWGQCTWYVYDQTGRGQNGNAGTWSPTSSTPAVGKIMIWRPGEQGARSAGHVGVVVAVSGNNVTVRHMNWDGFGVVSTGTFRSTGKFY